MKRKPEDRLNVFKLIRHPFLNLNKSYSKKTTGHNDPIDLFFEEVTPPKKSSDMSMDQEDQDHLKRSATEVQNTKDFKQIALKYRDSIQREPHSTVTVPEKQFTFEAPFIIDAQGRQRVFTMPNATLEKKASTQTNLAGERSTLKNSKVNFLKTEDSEGINSKLGSSSKGNGPKKLRIPIVRQGNTSIDSNRMESSRNLAINYKNRGLTLKVKADTNLGSRLPIHKTKNTHEDLDKDEYSDFDFDDDDEREEIIHEVKITIKEKRKLICPISKKLLKSQVNSKQEKTLNSVYEPKEADLLNNTPSREFFEVPKLVLGPIESETMKDLRSPLLAPKTPALKSARLYTQPDDFLSLEINPSHKLQK
jgi:hypothetical protein